MSTVDEVRKMEERIRSIDRMIPQTTRAHAKKLREERHELVQQMRKAAGMRATRKPRER